MLTPPRMKLAPMILACRATRSRQKERPVKSINRGMTPLNTASTQSTTAAMPHTPGRLMTYDRPAQFVLRSYGGMLVCTPPAVCHGENLMILLRGLKNVLRERTRYVSYLVSSLDSAIIDYLVGMGVGDHASANPGLHGYPLLYPLDGKVRRGLPLFASQT
jgi:hypothetical protein